MTTWYSTKDLLHAKTHKEVLFVDTVTSSLISPISQAWVGSYMNDEEDWISPDGYSFTAEEIQTKFNRYMLLPNCDLKES